MQTRAQDDTRETAQPCARVRPTRISLAHQVAYAHVRVCLSITTGCSVCLQESCLSPQIWYHGMLFQWNSPNSRQIADEILIWRAPLFCIFASFYSRCLQTIWKPCRAVSLQCNSLYRTQSQTFTAGKVSGVYFRHVSEV